MATSAASDGAWRERTSLPPYQFGILNLPSGMPTGFITVTLGFMLAKSGFSVAMIAGLVALNLAPATWRFLMGPALDLSLSGRSWYLISAGGLIAAAVAFALAPVSPAAMPLLSLLSLALGVTSTAITVSLTGIVAQTVPVESRGAVAGWMQAGNLGGTGVAGGAGLWIASHAGGVQAAALALAVFCLISAWPILPLRLPARPPGLTFTAQSVGLFGALVRLVRTRAGVLALLAVTLPAGLGAAGNLLPAVAGDWRASANLVALVTGLLGGLASVPGCILGGHLSDRIAPRPVFMAAALAYAAGEAAMALAPHTAVLFAGFVLLNAVLLGVTWGAVSAVIFECLDPLGGATIGSVLGSLCNVPVLFGVMFVGAVQGRHGSAAMLLAETGLGAVSVAGYALLAWLWRPDYATAPSVAAA